MKHWTLCLLCKSLHQQIFPVFKCTSSSLHLLHVSKFIQTYRRFITDKQANPTPSSFSECDPAFISPAYSKLLSQCCNDRCLKPALQIHAHIAESGLSDEPKLQSQLITCYCKNGVFSYAHKLIEGFPKSNVVPWNSLISGYAQNGFGEEALLGFREMHMMGIKCDEFTFPSALKACTITQDLRAGKQIQGNIIVKGFDFHVCVQSSLVVMYAKCYEFPDSRRIFEAIPDRDIVTWNALVSCYVKSNLCREAMGLFWEMMMCGVKPDGYSFSTMMNACTSLGDGVHGRKLHVHLIKLGYSSNLHSTNALVDMYAKLGDIKETIASFEEIQQPDIVSWNTIISGCFLHDYHDLALELLGWMRRSGFFPDIFTLSSILKGCSRLGLKELGKQLHSCLIKMDPKLYLVLSAGLIDMYSKCDLMEHARMVYHNMTVKDMVASNAMISGHSHSGEDRKALCVFSEMHRTGVGFDEVTLSAVLKSSAHLLAGAVVEQVHALHVKSGLPSDIYLASCLIDSYGKCGHLESAARIFEGHPVRDLVSFTSMITAYAEHGRVDEAVKILWNMQRMGLKPDQFTCSALLNACANSLAYKVGRQFHVQVLKLGFLSEIFAGDSLVNMYSKCGNINDAKDAFSEISNKESVSWNMIIGGLAQHGCGKEVLQLYNEMVKCGVSPSHVTMSSVLYACNHSGLVTEAMECFKSMKESHGIEPNKEHYGCMIDVLGRAGKLGEAVEMIDSMPFEANASAWGALLGASVRHKNIEVGKHAAEMLFALEPTKSGNYVLLANLYASAGMWNDVVKVRKVLKDAGVDSEPGMSWV